MARKGILVSDPQVQRTSPAQWLWDYITLHKKEQDDRIFWVKTLKDVLVSVLGLKVPVLDETGHPKPEDTLTEQEKESFVPYIYLGGNTQLLQKYFEKCQEPAAPNNPDEDAAYEELQRKMADAEGDMVPLDDPFVNIKPAEIVRRNDHKALGIIMVNDRDEPITSEVKISEAPPKPRFPTVMIEEDNG